jgi:RNA polymerase sigma factor (sigma-70 family)
MIEAIKRGDESAFEQAYIEFRGKVYGYLYKKTRCQEDARDLLQTTFLKLWQYRNSLSPDYLLEQHLFHIARTVFIDHIRKQNRHSRAHATAEYGLTGATQYSYISTEFDIRSRLGTALSDMPEIRKKVFELNRLQGYSYQEIAQQLSITVKAVDNNLTKALKHLRKTGLFFILIYFF